MYFILIMASNFNTKNQRKHPRKSKKMFKNEKKYLNV